MNFQKASAVILAIICLGLFSVILDVAQPVFVPLVIAILLSFVLAPAVELLRKIFIPKPVAIGIVILMILGLFFLIALFFYSSFQSFIRAYPGYQERLVQLVDDFTSWLAERLGMPTDLFGDISWPQMVRGYLLSVPGTFVGFARSIFIITIFLIFLLIEFPSLPEKLQKAFKETTSVKIGQVIGHIDKQIGRYLTLKILISSATGVSIWLSLTIIGMDFPVVWGFLGFILNFIPSIGSTVHFVVTSIFGFIQFLPGSVGQAIAVAVALFTIQSVLGTFLDPRLQGSRLDLSPFLVLFSLIFWGWLWGAVGMFLATPIIVAIKIVCENIPSLQAVSILMGRQGIRKFRMLKRKRGDDGEKENSDG